MKFRFLTNPIRLHRRRPALGEADGVRADAAGRARRLGPAHGLSPRQARTSSWTSTWSSSPWEPGPNPVLFSGSPDLERNERGYIESHSAVRAHSMPRVWAGGDIVTGSATVILAMGAARQAANDMHEYLTLESKDWA